jgi:hypothetical protein
MKAIFGIAAILAVAAIPATAATALKTNSTALKPVRAIGKPKAAVMPRTAAKANLRPTGQEKFGISIEHSPKMLQMQKSR